MITIDKKEYIDCDGYHICVTDKESLAKAIALVLMQERKLAKSLLNSDLATTSFHQLSATELDNLINEKIYLSRPERPIGAKHKEHRDGFLFQLMMWLTSHKDLDGNDIVSPPHAQPTAKGQDSFIVRKEGSGVSQITICEDKATINPRSTVRDGIWPEFRSYEKSERSDELRSNIITTLGVAGVVEDDAIDLIRGVLWDGKRHYRARVTVQQKARCSELFKGFSDITNDESKCRGESVELPDLRSWMDDFACMVENQLCALHQQ